MTAQKQQCLLWPQPHTGKGRGRQGPQQLMASEKRSSLWGSSPEHLTRDPQNPPPPAGKLLREAFGEGSLGQESRAATVPDQATQVEGKWQLEKNPQISPANQKVRIIA